LAFSITPTCCNVFRRVLAHINFLQEIDCFKRLGSRPVQRMVYGPRVHGLESAFDNIRHCGGLRLHLELSQIRQRNRAGVAP
jgi:hypothetical protein